MRRRVNKHIPDDIRELSMWSIALLVNTSNWPMVKENWKLICEVFFNYASNDTNKFKQHHASLLYRISKITSDPNSLKAINRSKEILSNTQEPFEFHDDDECRLDEYGQSLRQSDECIKNNSTTKSTKTSLASSSSVKRSVSNKKESNRVIL